MDLGQSPLEIQHLGSGNRHDYNVGDWLKMLPQDLMVMYSNWQVSRRWPANGLLGLKSFSRVRRCVKLRSTVDFRPLQSLRSMC